MTANPSDNHPSRQSSSPHPPGGVACPAGWSCHCSPRVMTSRSPPAGCGRCLSPWLGWSRHRFPLQGGDLPGLVGVVAMSMITLGAVGGGLACPIQGERFTR
ncbi:MAG: hypothetical protein H7835_07315 [Magnetococcus sp. XQGC-1]